MYVLITGTNEVIIGPFKSAKDAAAHARDQYPLAKWRIAPISKAIK